MNVEQEWLRSAGKKRLGDLERLIDEVLSEPTMEEAADEAARAHLAEHARLTGATEAPEQTPSG